MNDFHSIVTFEREKITGRDYRNYLPFAAHAMPIKNPYYWPSFEPCLNKFEPIDKNVDTNTWQASIACGNILSELYKYNGFSISIYFASQRIPENSPLLFNYGIDYWINGHKTPPALMYWDGRLVDPNTYQYVGEDYDLGLRKFFNGEPVAEGLSSSDNEESSILGDNPSLDEEPVIEPNEISPKERGSFNPIGMQVLGGFIAVLGIAAIAVAFAVLNASTFGIAGVSVAEIGATAVLLGVGLFSAGYLNQSKLESTTDNIANNFAI